MNTAEHHSFTAPVPPQGLPSSATTFGYSKTEWSWALYDWANSAFVTSVMAGFFPLFFKNYYAASLSAGESSLRLGLILSAITVLSLVLLPFASAVADRRGESLRFLKALTMLGAAATALLVVPAQGSWLLAALIYAVAATAFNSSLVFYDAMLPAMCAGEERASRLSILGYALGYLGGGLLLAVHAALFALGPSQLGLSPAAAVKIIFFSVAVWWVVCSLPLFRENPASLGLRPRGDTLPPSRGWEAALRLIGDFWDTLKELFHSPSSRWFLLAFFLYMDGVQTVIKMAVDYGLALNLQSTHLIGALLLTQIVGVPSAFAFQRVGERYGVKSALALGIAVYCIVVTWAGVMTTSSEFYLLAFLIGLSQGGIQALSRAWFSSLVTPARAAQSFLFFSLLSKSAAILGPLLMGAASWYFDAPRAGIVPIGVLLVAGGMLLLKAPAPDAGRLSA